MQAVAEARQTGEHAITPQADSIGAWSRPVVRAAAVCLLVGLGWRLLRYLLQFPIWGDEAFVLIDVHERDWLGLTQTLTFWQVAPLLFLWGEKLALTVLGTSELAVHLLPFLACTGGLVLFAVLGRRLLSPVHGALAVALLAVSYYPVRHGCEAKPYSLDLLMSVTLLLGAIAWLHEPRRAGWLIFLTACAPITICSSYPASFVAGGVSLAMLPKLRQSSWRIRAWYVAFNVVVVLAFAGHYLTVGRNQAGGPHAQLTDEFLHNYWREAFPPASLVELPLWLLLTHTGGLLAYPAGGAYGSSAGSLVLCILGAWYLWRRGQRSLLLVSVLPFALTLFAAFLSRYPYGGSARIAQHLAPMACILIAAGGAWLLDWVRTPLLRARWGCIACAALAAFGIVGAVRDVCKPYKTEYDRIARDLVGDFWVQVGPREPVVICNNISEVVVNYHWYLCRGERDIAWVGSEDIAPDAPGAWLLYFGLARPTAAQLQTRLTGPARYWTVAACEHFALPREAPDDATITWTKVRLVRVP